MKKNLSLILIFLISSFYCFGQFPYQISYQAVLRDLNGNILSNEVVDVNINILKGSTTGQVVFTEHHSTTSTGQGLISIQIGSKEDLSVINWGVDSYYLQIVINGSELGITRILGVPYAIHSRTAEILTEQIVETDPVFNDWDKSSGIVISEEQINNLKNYLETETDPIFVSKFEIENAQVNDMLKFDGEKWIKFTPDFLTGFSESDPVFSIWNKSEGIEINESQIVDFKNYLLTESDPKVDENFDFSNVQSGDLLMFNGTKWIKYTPNYLTEINETDPLFVTWNKSDGISVTEAQISDLREYLLSESDPSVAQNFNFSSAQTGDLLMFNGSKWIKHTPNYLTEINETDPVFIAWNKSDGISVTEAQISDLREYLLSESDPSVAQNFDFSSAQSGDLLMFNGSKWVKFTPNYLTDYSEKQGIPDVLAENNDANQLQIKNIMDPTDNQDAATKNYVDINKLPNGTSPGEMKYWDGEKWLPVAPGSHGQFLTFCDGKPMWGFCLPKLTTAEVTEKNGSKAKSGGNIFNNGGSEVIQKGVCWNDEPNPTIDNNLSNDGGGSGEYVSIVTGLMAGTTYYIRAYAINSGGVEYGNELYFFTTLTLPTIRTVEVDNVSAFSAQCIMEIVNTGGATITGGVCWSQNENPTILSEKTDNLTSTGNFNINIQDLEPSTTYFVRAYATNLEGTVYGEELSFTTTDGIPSFYTYAPDNVTATSVNSGGYVQSDGGASILQRGVCWNISENSTIMDWKTEDGEGTGEFTSSIQNLEPNTTYYIRSYVQNSIGVFYGDEFSFTTPSGIPTITTVEAENLTLTSSDVTVNIEDDGGAAITSRGVCWSLITEPTVNDFKTEDGSGTGFFTSNLQGLNPGTKYYVRAYAVNAVGVFYGNEVTFTTYDGTPLVSTFVPSNITATGFESGGNVINDFGADVSSRGVCWSSSPNPTIDDGNTDDGLGLGEFTSSVTGLTEWEIYYVRAYATNINGTGYGNEVRVMANNPITDIDGNSYQTVKIGTQIWMAENLKVTKLNNGSAISSTYPLANYYWYNGDITYKDYYGALYNAYAVKTPTLCPVGWHVPSDTDWSTLITYLGGEEIAGGKLKEEGTAHWLSPNTGATNEYLFTALPAGYRYNMMGMIEHHYVQIETIYWTSTIHDGDIFYFRKLNYEETSITRDSSFPLEMFEMVSESYSVRCIKD